MTLIWIQGWIGIIVVLTPTRDAVDSRLVTDINSTTTARSHTPTSSLPSTQTTVTGAPASWMPGNFSGTWFTMNPWSLSTTSYSTSPYPSTSTKPPSRTRTRRPWPTRPRPFPPLTSSTPESPPVGGSSSGQDSGSGESDKGVDIDKGSTDSPDVDGGDSKSGDSDDNWWRANGTTPGDLETTSQNLDQTNVTVSWHGNGASALVGGMGLSVLGTVALRILHTCI